MYEELDQMLETVCADEEMELETIFDMPADNQGNVAKAETLLGIQFPEDFRHFLLKYGSGGMGSFTFMGIESAQADEHAFTLVLLTTKCREQGMPKNLAVIEHNGDYVTCIDADNGSVVTWSWLGKQEVSRIADSFEDYFREKLEDYL